MEGVIRITLRDAFSKSIDIRTIPFSKEKMKLAENLLLSGQSINEFDKAKQISYNWQIEEVEHI